MVLREHNLLIEYRNSLLKSKGIEPRLYFIILEYFNYKYIFINEQCFNKNQFYNRSRGYPKPVNHLIVRELSEMFGIKKLKINLIILQIKTDKILYDSLIEESVVNNWRLLTLPDTPQVLDNLPF